MRFQLKLPLLLMLSAGLSLLWSGSARGQAAQNVFDPDNAFFAMTMEGFFPGESRGVPKRLNMYMQRRDGVWRAAIGTATYQGRAQWNTALQIGDPTDLEVSGDRITGKLKITLVPDPWVPADQKVRQVVVTINGTLTPAKDPKTAMMDIGGEWSTHFEGDAETQAKAHLAAGEVKGKLMGGTSTSSVPDVTDASYDLAMYGLMPGTSNAEFHRRRALSIGVKEGKAVSARLGMMDMRHSMFDYVTLDPPSESEITPDTFSTALKFEADTLDGQPATFDLKLKGQRIVNWVAGEWTGTYTPEDGQPQAISGKFRGDVRKGAVMAKRVVDPRPWFAPVANHKPVAPGEHPRLFFRKDDLPELRRRAETPEGQAIIQELRRRLNGTDGKTMPIAYNPAKQAYVDNKFKTVPGAYTISHAAGYGFLYQLTGDKLYADLARQCVEKAWEGQRSADDRYSWVAPGGELRAGPSIGWYAVAYDLCYDAWDPEFRQTVALRLQNYTDQLGGEWNNPENITLRGMVLTPKQGPGSNHFGAVVGGSGLVVLAIRGDPGTDEKLLDTYSKSIQRSIVRHFLAGWGDGGYYKEGWGASRVGTQGSFLCLLQAMKVCDGKDYLNVERTNATYVTMVPRALLVLGPPAYFPYRSNMGPTYGKPEIGADDQFAGMSTGGYFSEGFGAIADKHKPALLWMHNHVYDPGNKRIFDSANQYPHRAMLSLINWPTFSGIQEANPATCMPLATRDTMYEFFAFRNQFKDANDVVTSVLVNYPDGTKPREVLVWGMGGMRLTMGEPPRGAKITHYLTAADGSGSLTAGTFAMAVDHSRASGADVLVITRGTNVKTDQKLTDKARFTTLQWGETPVTILTLSATGQHPEAKIEADKLMVGGQTIEWNEDKLALKIFGGK